MENGENRGNHDYSKINVYISTHGKLYIFGKKRFPSLKKYIVFPGYYGEIFLAVNMISPIFPIFPSLLVPFSLIRNHMTPMQRNHIKILVSEKKRRNNLAIANNEDPDWTISAGFLHRRRQFQ